MSQHPRLTIQKGQVAASWLDSSGQTRLFIDHWQGSYFLGVQELWVTCDDNTTSCETCHQTLGTHGKRLEFMHT
eukprot:4123439-Pyramimonas_sp.AAC.2